jgi:DNA-binding NarL/FixJ family response regulator
MIRVLVVDDSDLVRNYIRTLLEFREDIQVCAEAENGKEGITKALECHPDLVILDLTMPKMDGFQAAVELRRRLPQLPILICSIHEIDENPQILKQVSQVGARGYINKENAPHLPDAIYALVLDKATYFPNSQSNT